MFVTCLTIAIPAVCLACFLVYWYYIPEFAEVAETVIF